MRTSLFEFEREEFNRAEAHQLDRRHAAQRIENLMWAMAHSSPGAGLFHAFDRMTLRAAPLEYLLGVEAFLRMLPHPVQRGHQGLFYSEPIVIDKNREALLSFLQGNPSSVQRER